MIKNVLLVDDDHEMLLALKAGFTKYRDSFAVQLAANGLKAVESLKKNVVSLVVTDLKMPRMDGFELLAHIMEYYPDIPVIIITGYSTPEMEHLARKGGAVGYIAKPFLIENLARQIMTTLRKESEGGTLHNVSSGMFLQLVGMEQKTCTIRLEDKFTSKKGILFFHEGELLDARVNDLQGEDAAYEVFSWNQVNLSIQNGCALKEKRIHLEMQYLILEAARRKDEGISEEAPPSVLEEVEPFESDPRTVIKSIQDKIENDLGPACGLEDIYQDDSWDSLIFQISGTGEFLNIGKLMLGYIDKGETSDYIVLPGEKTTVISVNPKCPRDKLLQVLSD
ncbi:Response regulator of zinc sigma-54-dependent two-component system [Olavius sp. associated proteobacterium Delta 1]|nr:Response regulator of zinc sigma-54-dependent two-component system [Olavius sp. associated proteobacterium Delta 1]